MCVTKENAGCTCVQRSLAGQDDHNKQPFFFYQGALCSSHHAGSFSVSFLADGGGRILKLAQFASDQAAGKSASATDAQLAELLT